MSYPPKNRPVSVLPSAARTASVNNTGVVGALKNYEHKGVQVAIDMTAVTATGSIVFTIEGYDEVSGKWGTILASAAVTTVSTVFLTVYPGVTETANVDAATILPRTWRVKAVAANAVSMTYSVGAVLVP